MGSRATLLRAGAALAGASMLITLSAMPAGADTATGVLDPHGDQRGYTVKLHHNGTHNELTTLIGLKLADGATVQTYCIELDTRLDGKYPKMVERAWDGYPVKGSPFHANRDKVNWVLHHSYPAAEVDELTAKVQAAGVAIEAGLTPQEAITATQAAIWHFSDNADLDLNDAVPGHPEAAKHVAKLYQYLTGKDNVGIGDQPNPALQVAPQEITSQAGKKVGPFKVTTNAQALTLTKTLPDGVKVVDGTGKELADKDIKNGTELFLDVPAAAKPGTASIKFDALAKLSLGRLFIGETYQQHPTQSLILAKAENTKLTDTIKASWGPATPTVSPSVPTKIPAGDDPQAGAPEAGHSGYTLPMIIGGVLLVGAGVGAFAFQRRRASSK